MNQIEFIKEVNKEFKNINSNWFELIKVYIDFLRNENKKINLTRLDSEDKIYSHYFFESLIPYRKIDFKKTKNILDIGSGSGIPGIFIKILYPHLELVIIDSSFKKVEFMNSLVNKLNLKKVNVICQRAEVINEKYYEYFDLVTSRAVSNSQIVTEISSQYCKINGVIVLPKSINYLKECSNYEKLGMTFGLKLKEIDQFVSCNNQTHNVIFFIKEHHTNKIYPRSWAKMLKNAVV